MLTEQGRKAVIAAWQARKQETVTHPFLQEKIPIGLIAFCQAQLLARVFRDDLDEYPPFHWRCLTVMLVVSYDVKTSDTGGSKRLRKVARLCEAYGVRVQNSVFELCIDPAQLVKFKADLVRVIDDEQDSIRIYRLGSSWQSKVESLGRMPRFEQEGLLLF
ncbi:MAG: CRISPR-associated endonuclease Cas2 [Oscillospiraceae bacterium]